MMDDDAAKHECMSDQREDSQISLVITSQNCYHFLLWAVILLVTKKLFGVYHDGPAGCWTGT